MNPRSKSLTPNKLAISRDVSDTYIIDHEAVAAIELQMETVLGEGEALRVILYLEHGAELAGSSLVQLLKHPLVTRNEMEGFSISSRGIIGYFDISVRTYGSHLSVDSDDPDSAHAAAEGMVKTLANARAWYRPIYRFDGELFAFAVITSTLFWCMFLAFEIRNPNWLWGVAALPAYFFVSFVKRFLFRKLEFIFGLSARRAASRSKIRSLLGTGVLLSFVVGLLVNYISSRYGA